MRKVYVLAAVAATMLAACSSKDALDVGQQTSNQPPLEEGAVGFDTYTQRSVTRAGLPGQMTLSQLQRSKADGGGFGVFAYYTDNNDYDQQRMPDFMYNQLVEYNSSSSQWTYEPVKYWPNEYGQSAMSDDNDKVSFFAYAPYVEVVPTSGKLTSASTTNQDAKWGIAGLSRNSATGDPLVKYIVSFDQDKSVDLMWGVCDDPQWSIVDTGSKQLINDGETGKPWLNVCRPQTVDQRMKFTFKHALTQLSVNVDAFVDGYDNTNPIPNADGNRTRVFIRQISFSGFALKGALNLNNSEDANKAYWLDFNGTTDLESGESVVIYDGRKDGKEGASGSVASNEKVLGLNPQFVQDAEWNSGEMALGVTKDAASLFRNYNETAQKYVASDKPLMVIPTGEDIEVEIVYDIETADENLATYVSDKKQFGSSIENRIRKPISFGGANFECGKHYTINLHLGMNSVKFDAEVSEWQEAGVSPDIDLPSNMPTFASSSSTTAAEYTSAVSIDYNTPTYLFAVSGLNGGEGVTASLTGLTSASVTVNSKSDFSGTNNSADMTGVAYIKVTGLPENKNVVNVTTNSAITVTGSASGKKRVIDLTQLAHPLGLTISLINDEMTEITLGTGATLTPTTNWQVASTTTPTEAASVKVLKNGIKLTKVDSTPSADGTFQFDTNNGKIVLGKAAAPGDVYTITVKTGDAQEETKQAKIGGIAFESATISMPYGYNYTVSNPITNTGATITGYTVTGSDFAVDANGNVSLANENLSTLNNPPTATVTVNYSSKDGYVVKGTSATYTVSVVKATGASIVPNYAAEGDETVKVTVTDIKNGINLKNTVLLKNALGGTLKQHSNAARYGGTVSINSAADLSYGAGTAPTASGMRYKLDADGFTLKPFYANPASSATNQHVHVGDKISVSASVDATGSNVVEYSTSTVSYTIEVVADN